VPLTIIADIHTIIGLLIVAFFLFRRSDRVLRLFGEALVGFALARAAWMFIQRDSAPLDDATTVVWVVIMTLAGLISLVCGMRVVIVQERFAWGAKALAAGGFVLVGLAAIFTSTIFVPDTGLEQFTLPAITLFLAAMFFVALHTVLEHSTGPGYRILFESAFAVIIMATAIEAVSGVITNVFDRPSTQVTDMVTFIATDAAGRTYTTETYHGRRVQRFLYKGEAPVADRQMGVVWPSD